MKLRDNSLTTGPIEMGGRCVLYRGMLDFQILWLTKILVVKFTLVFIMSPASLDMPRA